MAWDGRSRPFHSLVAFVAFVAVLQQPQVAALMLASPGETCHAVTGISASISSYRCTFRPALVVSSPIGAFPTSASRPLCVPTAFGCLLTVARVPLTSFIFYPDVITSVHDVKDQFSSHLVEGGGIEPPLIRGFHGVTAMRRLMLHYPCRLALVPAFPSMPFTSTASGRHTCRS